MPMKASDLRKISKKAILTNQNAEEVKYKEFVKNNKQYLEKVENYMKVVASEGRYFVKLADSADVLKDYVGPYFHLNLIARYFRELGYKFETNGWVISWGDDE